MKADLYWVVAHREDVSAAELSAAGKQVHLTVRDDPAAVFAKSRKLRLFQALISLVFSRVLKSAASVHVICHAMREFYNRHHGVNSFPLDRYLPALSTVNFVPGNGMVRIGHIGPLYHPGPFGQFCQGLQAVRCRPKNKAAKNR